MSNRQMSQPDTSDRSLLEVFEQHRDEVAQWAKARRTAGQIAFLMSPHLGGWIPHRATVARVLDTMGVRQHKPKQPNPERPYTVADTSDLGPPEETQWGDVIAWRNRYAPHATRLSEVNAVRRAKGLVEWRVRRASNT